MFLLLCVGNRNLGFSNSQRIQSGVSPPRPEGELNKHAATPTRTSEPRICMYLVAIGWKKWFAESKDCSSRQLYLVVEHRLLEHQATTVVFRLQCSTGCFHVQLNAQRPAHVQCKDTEWGNSWNRTRPGRRTMAAHSSLE